jgi:hypothetical protein
MGPFAYLSPHRLPVNNPGTRIHYICPILDVPLHDTQNRLRLFIRWSPVLTP